MMTAPLTSIAALELSRDIDARFCASLAEALMRPDRCADADIHGPMLERLAAAIRRAWTEHAEPQSWLYFRIAVAAGEGNAVMATTVAPLLALHEQQQAIHSWWWLNKTDVLGSAIRLRVLAPPVDRASLRELLESRLRAAGLSVSTLIYEPEMCLFGGSAGMSIAHRYFFEDSRFLVAWIRSGDPHRTPAVPDGLALALGLRLLQAAGLDLFETWDVFARVLDKRGRWAARAPPNGRHGTLVRHVLNVGPHAVFGLYDDDERALLHDYDTSLSLTGLELARTHGEGRLECGMREFLAPLLLFQWNRTGLSGPRQHALAHAVVSELRVRARQPANES